MRNIYSMANRKKMFCTAVPVFQPMGWSVSLGALQDGVHRNVHKLELISFSFLVTVV